MRREERNNIISLSNERVRRYKVMRMRQIRNKCFLALFTVLIVALLTVTLQSISSHALEQDKEIRYKYYTTIEVAYGDTLWSIADRFMTYEYEDNNAYIEEVQRLNHLADSGIDAGNYLIVPYYSSELK